MDIWRKVRILRPAGHVALLAIRWSTAISVWGSPRNQWAIWS